ncbi:membrane protein [Flavobacterium sp. 316]|uniref:exosortase F system-associated membrane protein n=1 Tax=Flavobacterium sp. 316 TaxID=1603293 RepID=UPI0005E667D3|nr:exosortase F system-associated protein [Flavobacterium sp. 316]KIX21898.1 membrane protein [Flavobacterium sp. 316]
MVKELFKDKKKILWLFILLLFIVMIRTFERTLFYDPFLSFFKSEYHKKELPEFNTLKLFLNLLIRYTLNTILSLSILYLLFKQKKIVVFSSWLYFWLFVILILIFFSILMFDAKPNYLMLFYVRRFLIQPLFLILFIPAFYYNKVIK